MKSGPTTVMEAEYSGAASSMEESYKANLGSVNLRSLVVSKNKLEYNVPFVFI